MKIKLPFNRNPEKERTLALARQAAAFYDIAAAKGGMSVRGRTKDAYKRRKGIKGKDHGPTPPRTEPRKKKKPYNPGTLGPSEVAQRIAYDYGAVYNRNERKALAAAGHFPMRCYRNEADDQ
jgi:hypothetical protein